MRIPPELLPVLQITLPLVGAIFGAAWLQNKRLDDLINRVTAIEQRLSGIEQRLARLEERTPPLVHR